VDVSIRVRKKVEYPASPCVACGAIEAAVEERGLGCGRPTHVVRSSSFSVVVASIAAAPVAEAAPSCHGHRATIVGTGGHDALHGKPKRDVIGAFGGADRIWGGGGDDIVCAGLGADVVSGGSGSDLLDGQGDADRFSGGRGDDLLIGSAGNDRQSGGLGADHLLASEGSDRLDGGGDHDSASFVEQGSIHLDLKRGKATGWGADTLSSIERVTGSGHAGDTFVGTRGADTFFGAGGGDLLRGRGGNDRLVGARGDDHLLSGGGNDRLFGNVGNDHLDGGPGNDHANGGQGRDVCSHVEGTEGTASVAERIPALRLGAGRRVDLRNFLPIGFSSHPAPGARYPRLSWDDLRQDWNCPPWTPNAAFLWSPESLSTQGGDMHGRRVAAAIAISMLATVVVPLLAGTASATLPGTNGVIAFARMRHGNGHIFSSARSLSRARPRGTG
jgi:hypothetical protein